MKAKTLILFLSLCVLLSLSSCQNGNKDKAEWEGSIEKKDEVRIVNNPERIIKFLSDKKIFPLK